MIQGRVLVWEQRGCNLSLKNPDSMVGLRMRLPGLHSKPAFLELNRTDADQHLMQSTLVLPKPLSAWSRDEVTGIGFESSRIFLPSFNNGLAGCFPSDRLEVFGKVEGADEGEHMRLQALPIRVMEGFDRGLLGGAVHALGRPVCPRVIRFCPLVGNTVFIANAAKDVHTQKGMDGLVSVLGQVCKSHAVVGQNGADLVGEGFDHAAQEVCAIHLSHVVPKLDIGELGHSVDGQKHVEFALSQAQLGTVNVHITDFGRRKLAPCGGFDIARWRAVRCNA